MEFMNELGVLALGSRLKRLSEMFMSEGKTIYDNTDIDFDPKWFPIFKLLSVHSPLGIMEISEKLNISHPYVIQLTKGLEKKGLVDNIIDAHDARKRAIKLSPKGENLLTELQPLWSDIQETISATLRESNNDLLSNIILLENSFKEKSFYERVKETQKKRKNKPVDIVNFIPELGAKFRTLNEEWLEKYFNIEPVDVEVLGNPIEKIIKPGGAIIFAIVDGEVVGTCALKLTSPGIYELTKMAVTEKAQGYQIGKKLGQRIIEIGKEKGADLIFLESNRRLTTALNLYRKLGFVEAINPKPSDYVRSDIYMELK